MFYCFKLLGFSLCYLPELCGPYIFIEEKYKNEEKKSHPEYPKSSEDYCFAYKIIHKNTIIVCSGANLLATVRGVNHEN